MATAGREFFTVRTVSAALREFRPDHRSGVMNVPLEAAHGRVCAAEVRAPAALPGFARSSVDGYALRARDTFGASEAIPAYLRVTGAVRMGVPAAEPVVKGAAIEVPTGGMLPRGADAVVMVEHTQEAMPGTVEVVRAVAPGEGVVRSDEDAAPGSTIAPHGRRLRAQDVAMLAACGILEVAVHAAPRVTIIATGDEIVPPATRALAPACVRDALSVSIAALVREAGGEPAPPVIVRDDRLALERALGDGLADSDLVVICAGSSVGMRDQTAAAVASLEHAKTWCHGLAIKPGKPTLLADCGGKPIIGLPGNPRSALVVFRLLGMPLLRRVGGEEIAPLVGSLRARLARDLPSAAGRLDVVQVRVRDGLALDVVQVRVRDGLAEPVFGSSALLSVLTRADGYLIVPEDANGLSAGEPVEVIPYL
jgi:molybdopterin molybdotransferase